jgi:membrane protease YdiL (CAAX protease family)
MKLPQNSKQILLKLYNTKLLQSITLIIILVFLVSLGLNKLNLKQIEIFSNFPSLLFLLSIIIQTMIFLTPIMIDKNPDLGFKKFSIKKTILAILVGYISFIFIAVLVQLSGLSLPGFGQQESYLPLFGDDKFSIASSIISTVILASIGEELLFRGYLFSKISTEFNQNIAILLTSLAFATFHLQFNVIIPLFILGLIIGNIRKYTNSVIPAIIFHSINNGLALYVSYNLPT